MGCHFIIVTAHYGEKGSAVIPALGEPLRVKFNGKKLNNAGVAELADALDSGSSESNFMQVQVLFPAPAKLFAKAKSFCFTFFRISPTEFPLFAKNCITHRI